MISTDRGTPIWSMYTAVVDTIAAVASASTMRRRSGRLAKRHMPR